MGRGERRKTGRRAILAAEKRMFSTGTHRVARRPVSTLSWSTKMVHMMTDAMNSTFHPNGAGMYLCPKPAITYTMATTTATTAHIAYARVSQI